MDFGFSAEEEAFREDVRRFLKQEVTDGVRAEVESGMGFGPHTWGLLRKLGAERWLTPQWPEKYGGMGATYVQKFIIQEELAYAGGPETLIAVSMAGPVVLRYGSEEQK
ncbi:MAG: acyl-CoA dehydrogenase family protein, partial [Chloroflexota bacterium]